MSGVETVEITADEAGLRLDRWFRRRYPGLGHGRLEKLLRTGQVRVDGRRAKAGNRLEHGQQIRVPPLSAEASAAPARRPDAKLDASERAALQEMVLHVDRHVIAINKPAGLAVQGGSGTRRHLDGMLDALRFGSAERPRLVHRLDRDTSGVLILGRTPAATAALTRSFRQRSAQKLYWAVTKGTPIPHTGRIDQALAKGTVRGGERMMAADLGDGVGDSGLRARRHLLHRPAERAGTRLPGQTSRLTWS